MTPPSHTGTTVAESGVPEQPAGRLDRILRATYRLARVRLEQDPAMRDSEAGDDDVAERMRRLSRLQREILLLHAALIDTEQISRMLHITPATVRRQLQHAVIHLHPTASTHMSPNAADDRAAT